MTWHNHMYAGNSALARGLFDEAEYRFKTAIREARKLSVLDAEITDVMRKLGRLSLDRGRAEEALALAKEARELDQSYWFGPSEQVCEDLVLIADAASALSRYNEAVAAYSAAAELHEQYYGHDHDATMKVLAKLMVIGLECEPALSERVAPRVLAYFSRLSPPGTLCSSIGFDQHLKELIRAEQPARAESFFKSASAILRKQLGDHNREVPGLQKLYAEVLAGSNRQLSAWKLKSTAEMQNKKDDVMHRADDLMLRGRYEEAEPLLRQYLTSLQIDYGPSHPLTVAARKKYSAVVNRLPAMQKTSLRNSLREKVLDVIARMAFGGSQWRTECADAMQIHSIAPTEVHARLSQLRGNTASGGALGSSAEGSSLVRDFLHHSSSGAPLSPSCPSFATRPHSQLPSTRMPAQPSWPAPQDYSEAVQNPESAFFDPELKTASVEMNALGLPVVATGSFASVYKFSCGSDLKAVRFFLSPMRDREYRYQQLSDYICSDDLIYTVNFEYHQQGVRFGSQIVPLLKMEWVDGEPLQFYIDNHLLEDGAMMHLRKIFRKMTAALHAAGVAHGDLQHGNIIVRDNEIVLVDYDGMYVPALLGHSSAEIGHPSYQHPSRNSTHFGPYLDNFSAWVIDVAISALCIDPSLWYDLKGGDENLLFKKSDFLEPGKSMVFRTLMNHSSLEIRQRTELLLNQLNQPLERIPSLGEDGSPIHAAD